MGFWSGLKKGAKPFVDVQSWLNLDQLKNYGKSISDIGKSLFIPQKASRNETFEQAIRRFNLSEADLNKKAENLYNLSIIFCAIALCLLGYVIYLIITHASIMAVIVTLVLSSIILTKAFSYHFWVFQIKKRRLGCSLQEWFKEGLLGIKK
jgi:intracellular multiplication protein IcmV